MGAALPRVLPGGAMTPKVEPLGMNLGPNGCRPAVCSARWVQVQGMTRNAEPMENEPRHAGVNGCRPAYTRWR